MECLGYNQECCDTLECHLFIIIRQHQQQTLQFLLSDNLATGTSVLWLHQPAEAFLSMSMSNPSPSAADSPSIVLNKSVHFSTLLLSPFESKDLSKQAWTVTAVSL